MKKSRVLCGILAAAMLLTGGAWAAGAESVSVEPEDNCTAVYVGSAVSEDGTTMLARCADTHPTTVACSLLVTEACDEPGRIVTGKNGFVYTLPDSTYQYWSVPRPAALEKGDSWDSVASNEKGVAVTATVTGYVCEAALSADPYVADGLTEDNIAGLVAACADSSRHAIELIASIIDEQGSGESNIFLVADTEECWYMEIYTGHQYAAVRLPEDCVAGFGNEFMLEELDGFDEVICSEGLQSVPEEAGFAEYTEEGSLNLFDTYSGKGRLADYANLRTWRVHNLLAPSTAGEYDTGTKYAFLYTPDEKVSTADLIAIFRDRMEGTEYETAVSEGKVRIIGTETASQVHVMKVHKDLPAAIAVETWLCLSNAAYSPFIPLSNAITSSIEEYEYVLPAYSWDENSAHCLYKRLNALAAQNRTLYGLGIESMWQELEAIWAAEYTEILQQAAALYETGRTDAAVELLTAYGKTVQRQALTQAVQTTEDLMWFIMENTDTLAYDFSYGSLQYADTKNEPAVFVPLVNAVDYAAAQGWSCETVGESRILTREGSTLTITPSDGKRTSTGSIATDDGETAVTAFDRDGALYLALDTAREYLK